MAAATGNMFGDVHCRREAAPDGGFTLHNDAPLEAYPDTVFAALRARAAVHPDKPLYRVIQPGAEDLKISYGRVLERCLESAAVLQANASANPGPVALVAENGIDTALVILAAYAAGIPVAPISSAYSRLSNDYQKLFHILDLLAPSVVIFDDAELHAGAIAALQDRPETTALTIAAFANAGDGVLSWTETRARTSYSPQDMDPDAIAKILFTSGSTGLPKGVINTHRMMMSNQQALAQIWPVIGSNEVRLADWLPWNHTFGGNQNFNMAVFHGGTLTIDQGKPAPDLIDDTVTAIKRTRPTAYFNVPRGFDMLLACLRQDEELQEALFADLNIIGYAGAALPTPIWTELRSLARRVKGHEIPVVGLWGSTETGPVATAVYFPSDDPRNIGLPLPGCSLKFAPDGSGKSEMRVRAPSVTPGYWGQEDITTAAFDADGYFKMGDAGKLIDDAAAEKGILFDGRLGENFKLLSGTWVNVGALRLALIAACPELIADAVIAGHNEIHVSALIFPKIDNCRLLTGELDAEVERILSHPKVTRPIVDALESHNRSAGGSSQRIAACILLAEPPDIDGSEITDKGYLNQRAVLERRTDKVALIYGGPSSEQVLTIE